MNQEESSASDLQRAGAVLGAQPFSVLLGAHIVHFGAGRASIEVPARSDLNQQNGFLHGGVIAYALDNAITFAAATVLGSQVLTSGVAVTYLRPAMGSIVAAATVVGNTRRQAVVRCEVTSVDTHGEIVLVACGQGTVTVTSTSEA